MNKRQLREQVAKLLEQMNPEQTPRGRMVAWEAVVANGIAVDWYTFKRLWLHWTYYKAARG